MAQNGQKILLVAKLKQKINRLNNAIADKNSNFDIKNFKTGINSDLDELEQIVKVEIDSTESKSDVEELTKEVLDLRQNAEEAVEKYEATVCHGKLALFKMAVPTKATVRSVATTLIFNWRIGCRCGSILLAAAVLIIRCIFQDQIWWAWYDSMRYNPYPYDPYNSGYYGSGGYQYTDFYDSDDNVYGDIALKATAWTCISFSLFLGLLNIVEKLIGINSIGCKVFEILMSVASVALWTLSIALIVKYNMDYYGGYPKGYNIVQLTLCSLSLLIQILWILANVREIIIIRRNRRCNNWEKLPIEKQSSIATLT